MSIEERDVFDALYAGNAESVYKTALAILKNPDAAHDVVHDVFLRAWHHADQYDPLRGSAGVWLRAVARNLAIDRLRAAQRLVAREGAFSEAGNTSTEFLSQLLRGEEMGSVRRAFRMLPEPHQRLIEMAYDQALSHSQIAKQLGQPLGTVKSRIRQAVAMLRTYASGGLAESPEPAKVSWLEPVSEAFTVEADADELNACPQLPCLSVLVVDDDHETVRLVSAVLRKFGLRARTCMSAQEGLAALRASWPDVLISDLSMPGEDGYSFIGRAHALARDNGRRLRAAAFTSWASEHERSRALIAGFEVFINKPVHPMALVSAVARLSHQHPAS